MGVLYGGSLGSVSLASRKMPEYSHAMYESISPQGGERGLTSLWLQPSFLVLRGYMWPCRIVSSQDWFSCHPHTHSQFWHQADLGCNPRSSIWCLSGFLAHPWTFWSFHFLTHIFITRSVWRSTHHAHFHHQVSVKIKSWRCFAGDNKAGGSAIYSSQPQVTSCQAWMMKRRKKRRSKRGEKGNNEEDQEEGE